MDKEELKAHNQQRKELWCGVWIGTANAANCTSVETATKWADKALEDFDKRFPIIKND